MYRRHELSLGSNMERENLYLNVKGNDKWSTTTRKNTEVEYRGGAARSSDEAVVMSVERRGRVILLMRCVNE